MKKIHSGLFIMAVIFVTLFTASCSKDKDICSTPEYSEPGLLQMSAKFGFQTRLSELPGGNEMADDEHGLYDVGLYIYYTEDYDNDLVSEPYICNMRCTVSNNMLFPVLEPGEDPMNQNIYIYDRMTIVAFYPYNAEFVDPFQSKEEEESYVITRNDYSEQTYIPYRAEKKINPTNAYYVELWFYPKHTYKVEIVVVSDDPAQLPGTANVKILPNIDPVDNDDIITDGKRELWVDHHFDEADRGGGSAIIQYTAYIWTKEEGDNDIKKGEVLLESGNLTLIASQDITVNEQRVFRYGYNMSTGEIFIPTSSNLVHDVPSLQNIDGKQGDFYQVCDIDASYAGNWAPLYFNGGRFDGGGHKIYDLEINTNQNMAGLFGKIQGNTNVCNVNLVDPVITVTNTTDTCFVGALCGQVNAPLTEAERQKLISGIPGDLSEVVKQALIAEMLADALNSTTKIASCRVENPTIVVNGYMPRVGSVCGEAGNANEEGNFNTIIWDSYSLGGSISVNSSNRELNEGGYTGGFCGLNNGIITRSYSTTGDIDFKKLQDAVDGNGQPIKVPVDAARGFTTMGTEYHQLNGSVTDSYSILPDPTAGVSQFPSWPSGWVKYTGIWPILTTGWLANTNNSYWYDMGNMQDIYPTLQWERR